MGAANTFTVNSNMFGKFPSLPLRNIVAVGLALCMPCQAMFADLCLCVSKSNCPCGSAASGESRDNAPCCCGCVCSSDDNKQSSGPSNSCQCQKVPLSGLPFSPLDSRSLLKNLQVGTNVFVPATSNTLDLSRQMAFGSTQDTFCLVQQPCILFCRFLL